MTKSINKQVEAQGVKKLDSFKGFQELNAKELQEIEGGFRFNFFNIFSYDDSRPKGDRWQWGGFN